MTSAPEHLYNLYLTHDIVQTGTQLALFYTLTGDTLIAGAGQADGNYIPNVYQKSYGQKQCELCPAGTYGDARARSSCKVCPVGTFNPETGSTSAMACQ